MGKCVDKGYIPYTKITVCDGCFHRDVCGDRDYLTENVCTARASGVWISVKERLPGDEKYNGTVLATDGATIITAPSSSVVRDGAITHWMPLPEPPKEE